MRRAAVQIADLENVILKRVRAASGISRVQVARDLGLSASTSGLYVERLIAEGFLVEAEAVERSAGRPPRLLKMNPEGGEFIGVDFEAGFQLGYHRFVMFVFSVSFKAGFQCGVLQFKPANQIYTHAVASRTRVI